MYIILFLIIILLILIIYGIYSRKEGFTRKCLLVLYGESFRDGPKHDRTIDTESGYINQMKACESHVKFIKELKSKYNIDTDIVISSYSTKYKKDLLNKYNDYTVKSVFKEELIGQSNSAYEGIQTYKDNLNEYSFMIVTRNDIFIKDEFIHKLNIDSDRILFTNQLWTNYDCFYDGTEKEPMVNPTIIFIPNIFFYITDKINIEHTAWKYYKDNFNITNNNMGFILNTYHDSNTADDFNPIYYMVGRNDTLEWLDKDKINTNNWDTMEINCYTTR